MYLLLYLISIVNIHANIHNDILIDELNVNILLRSTLQENSSTYHLSTPDDLHLLRRALLQRPQTVELRIGTRYRHIIGETLQRNSLLISKSLFNSQNSQRRKAAFGTRNRIYEDLSYCYYIGRHAKENNLIVSLYLCRGVKGTVQVDDKYYHIQPVINNNSVIHRLIELDNYNQNLLPANLQKKRRKRGTPLTTTHNIATRYVEMYIVVDNGVHNNIGTLEQTHQHVFDVINHASALYAPLNIRLAIVGIQVWTEGNQIKYSGFKEKPENAGKDPSQVLSEHLMYNLCKYRKAKILPTTPNDVTLLLTNATRYGVAYVGTVCSTEQSCGIVSDVPSISSHLLSVHLAHELGHNLGLPHSPHTCRCRTKFGYQYFTCVMHEKAIDLGHSFRNWSRCSRTKLREGFEANLDQCLKNKPEESDESDFRSVCGNYFVEEGEQCDCGPTARCRSKCCQPRNCRLRRRASCSTGSCCDLDTCSIKAQGHLCRPIQDSECDLEEFCDGRSEWCPSDKYKQDGTPCYNRGDAFCYEGKCNSHTSQCRFIYGNSLKKADDICFSGYNSLGNKYGNCGWSWVKNRRNKLNLEYHACDAVQDKFCGLLHCQPKYLNASEINPVIKNKPFYTVVHRAGVTCAISSFNVGLNTLDPGQVPNGAKCAPNSMCINSKCIQVNRSKQTSTTSTSTTPPKESTTGPRVESTTGPRVESNTTARPPMSTSSERSDLSSSLLTVSSTNIKFLITTSSDLETGTDELLIIARSLITVLIPSISVTAVAILILMALILVRRRIREQRNNRKKLQV